MTAEPALKTDGQVAYEAYYADCGGKSVHGEDLPSWDGQRPEIRAHWEAAARAVVSMIARVYEEGAPE